MKNLQKTRFVIACVLLLSLNGAFASEFFASNNTKEINLQTAYNRFTGIEQSNLQNSIISVMQKNHIEQGKFENIIGTYQMSSDKNITADNTALFVASPKQNLSDKKVFLIAKELAVKLHQDSVAVFIPGKSSTGEIVVSFASHQPSINKLVNILHKKLPKLYNQAFSLHLINTCHDFSNAKVNEIEWLGSKISPKIIKNAFPSEKINARYGKVFLVYQNGKKEQL